MPRPRTRASTAAVFSTAKFKHWREKVRHIRQDELARLLGCSQSRISLIERGKRRPDDAFFQQLEARFGIPPRQFFIDGGP